MVANGEFKPAALMVERPGLQSTIQDFGRFGIWDIGCPPNGPQLLREFQPPASCLEQT